MPVLTLFLTLLSVPNAASADKAPSELCVPRRELLMRNNNCKDNINYVKAADICLSKLDAMTKAHSESVSGRMARKSETVTEKSGSGQHTHIQSIERGHDESTATVEDVKSYALKLRAEIVEYSNIFVWPFSLPPSLGRSGKARARLMQDECYRTHQLALRDRLTLIDRKIAELGNVAGTIQGHQQTLSGRGEKLGDWKTTVKPAPRK